VSQTAGSGPTGAPAPIGAAGLLPERVAHHASVNPDGRAVVEVGSHGNREWTWSQLVAATGGAREELAGLGMGEGETVAYQLANRLEFVALSLAIIELGGTCLPLMPIFREHELSLMLAQAEPRILYVPDTFRGHDHLAMAKRLQTGLPGLEHVIAVPDAPRLSPIRPTAATSNTARPDQLVDLLFTSGTSGQPKGALHRHDRLMAAVDRHISHFGLGSDDVIFCPAPLAHQTGFLYGMWLALALGAPLVVQEIWAGGPGFDAMARYDVSFVQVATPFLADLVAVAEERDQTLAHLKLFVATGAAVPRELARRARTVLGADVGGGFGSTETCMAAAFSPGEDPERAWQTDGRALPGVSLRVTDDQGEVLEPGVEGNFEIATGTLFSGYLKRPDLSQAAITADGFYRTGDLAVIGADGDLRITGRTRDVINRGGEKVPVAEVEQLIYEMPGVREAAIVAMPDPRLVERACAFVVLAPGHALDLLDVREHLDARRLSKPYWPERIEVVDELPKTPSGKIKKFVLREQAAALMQDKVGL
jgi:cyclohexanecarboxylate-CoA ligase